MNSNQNKKESPVEAVPLKSRKRETLPKKVGLDNEKKRKNEGKSDIVPPQKKRPRTQKEIDKSISDNEMGLDYIKNVLLNEKFVQFLSKETIENLKKLKNNEEVSKFRETHNACLVSLLDENKRNLKFPEEILKFFPGISMLNTKGNRKTYLELMSCLNPNYLKNFSYKGSCYSQKKN